MAHNVANAPSPETGLIPLGQVLENLADELVLAAGICVNVEEIIADSLIDGVPDCRFIRVELQNLDRLIQVLTDLYGLLRHLAGAAGTLQVRTAEAAACLVMEEMRQRLLSPTPTRVSQASPSGSDVTFF